MAPPCGFVRIVRIAEEHGLRDFGQFQGHPDETDDPHPEDGARAAKRDRNGHTGDVAQADGPGERGRKGLEVVDGAGVRSCRRTCPGPRRHHASESGTG
jgi:hypothetical protein